MKFLKKVKNNKVLDSKIFHIYKTSSIVCKILFFGIVVALILIGIQIYNNSNNSNKPSANSSELVELIELDYVRKNRNFDLYSDPNDINLSNKLSKYNISILDESLLKKICIDIAEEGVDLVTVKDNLIGKTIEGKYEIANIRYATSTVKRKTSQINDEIFLKSITESSAYSINISEYYYEGVNIFSNQTNEDISIITRVIFDFKEL